MSSIPNPLIKFEEICNFPFTEWTRTSRFIDYKLSKLGFLTKKRIKQFDRQFTYLHLILSSFPSLKSEKFTIPQ